MGQIQSAPPAARAAFCCARVALKTSLMNSAHKMRKAMIEIPFVKVRHIALRHPGSDSLAS
jgi:hypothetical protein